MSRAVALLWLVVGAPAFAAAHALAVLPFKNLNADPATDWLKLGIAETMVADLKKAGHTMVERDQVDKALAELALQGAKLDDDSRAAKAGKLMGAATVVVGGYQQAGEQLRITARFVSVESGVVERTAKVTGKMTEVFELQDQIVAELAKLKGPAPAAKGRPAPVRRPGTQKTLAAYKSYAQALSSSSQAERVEKLQEALELDPGFTYAADDLQALKQRLNVYEKESIRVTDAQGKKLWAELNDRSLSMQDRNLKAMQYLTTLQQRFRYGALLEEAQKVHALKLEAAGMVNGREYASYCVFLAAMMLKKTDLALQAGERHLKEFPGGTYSGSLDMQMRSMVEQLQRAEDQRAEGRKRMAELEKERPPRNADQQRSRDFQRCSNTANYGLWDDAERECTSYVEKYSGQADPHDFVPLAKWQLSRAHNERGMFGKARAAAEALVKEYPEFSRKMSLEMQLRTWPQP